MNTNKKQLVFKMIRNGILLLIALLLFWVAFHYAMKAFEQNKYPAKGQFVEVDGQQMHVYTEGEGEQTIVLLSGLGTPSPVLDFEPLVHELAQTNKVVVVENFGYGWSDLTKKERTVENIVEELRLALQQSNLAAPYILMPHSISGIYSMYYANNYPEEVQAIIGIDPKLPSSIDSFSSTPSLMKMVAPTGVGRLLASIFSVNYLPNAEEGTYSDENLKATKAILSRNISNKNIIEESNELQRNVEKTKDMSFPSELPVMIFAANNDTEEEDGETNRTFDEEQLSDNPSNQMIELEGSHYLHWTQSKEIAQYTNEFIQQMTK